MSDLHKNVNLIFFTHARGLLYTYIYYVYMYGLGRFVPYVINIKLSLSKKLLLVVLHCQ